MLGPTMLRERIAPKEPVLVVVNPRAGRGAARRRAARLVAELQRVGVPFVVRPTERPGHARDLAAATSGAVVAVGGDGTAHEVLNGLRERDGRLGPFAVLPAGSGNDFAANAGFSRDPHDLAAALHDGWTRTVDVGAVEIACEHGELRRHFLNDAGVGFEADVVRTAAGMRWLRGRLLYLAATLRAVRRQRIVDCELTYATVDDEVRETMPILFASACNGGRVGGGLHFAPAACIDDGRVDVLRVSSDSAAATLRLLMQLVRRRHDRDPRVRIARCDRVVMRPAQPLPVSLDGELVAASATRVEASVRRGRLVLAGLRPPPVASVRPS